MSRKKHKSKTQPKSASPVMLGMLAALCITLFGVWMFRGEMKKAMPQVAEAEAPAVFELNPDAKVHALYAGSASCRECHEEAFELWQTSNHGLAERLPVANREDPAFVPSRSFDHVTQSTEVRKEGGDYEVLTPGLGGTNGPFKVDRVIGNAPLVQFLTPFPGGRWQTLEASYDPVSNEWFNVYGEQDRMPGEWGHWSGRGMNWNNMCASCHNTRLRKNYDPATDTYHTTMAEMTVGCEACHGPMKDHVVWQEKHGDKVTDPTLKPLSREQMFDTCAACHSRRSELTGDFVPGDDFYDHHLLSIVDESDTWYPDGQNWDEDYEYTAFLGSRMHQKNIRCVDCHDFHSAKVRLPGNLMCLSCHAVGMTNAPTIVPTEHSFHKADNDGNLCTGCHMPQTAYMERHWRHDHGFTIPDPVLTRQFGIPNACNRCHQDKDVDWSIEYVEQWYGDKMDRPYRKRARTIARAKEGDESVQDALLTMLGVDENAYWRAVAARMLAQWAGEPTVAAALLDQLSDTNALVRVNSIRSLLPLVESGNEEVRTALKQHLEDPIRSVRFVAANALGSEVETDSLAGTELLRILQQNADQPLGQMQLGAYHFARRHTARSLQHYKTAVDWDPYSAPIRHDYAVVLSITGQRIAAAEQLREVCRLAPDEAEYHYKLALALNETGDLNETIIELERAVQLDAQHARAWYNLGLARNGMGDPAGAVEALLQAEAAESGDAAFPYARATILANGGDFVGAQEAARRALAIDPDFAEADALLRNLQGNR